MAFFSIIKKIEELIFTKFPTFKDFNWLYIPGFYVVIMSVLHQLVECDISVYPPILIDTMKIFINKPNVMNSFIETIVKKIK